MIRKMSNGSLFHPMNAQINGLCYGGNALM